MRPKSRIEVAAVSFLMFSNVPKGGRRSARGLRVAEVVKMDMKIEDGKVTAYRTRVALSFKYETS